MCLIHNAVSFWLARVSEGRVATTRLCIHGRRYMLRHMPKPLKCGRCGTEHWSSQPCPGSKPKARGAGDVSGLVVHQRPYVRPPTLGAIPVKLVEGCLIDISPEACDRAAKNLLLEGEGAHLHIAANLLLALRGRITELEALAKLADDHRCRNREAMRAKRAQGKAP